MQEPPKATPLRGCIAIGRYQFPEQFSEFSFRTLLTKGEVISALGKIKVRACSCRHVLETAPPEQADVCMSTETN